jgi:copper transport protein
VAAANFMMRRLAVAASVVGLLVVAGAPPSPAWGHAALQRTEPAADAALDVAPTAVRLTFSEQPERSLSTVRVVDAAGTAFEEGLAQPVPGDPLSLTVALRPLDRGVYTVTWRVVSAVDGHPTAGAYAFGVGVSPTAAATTEAAQTKAPPPSRHELVGRWLFLAGLVALVGAAAAVVAGFAGPSGGAASALALGAWVASAVGLVLLGEAQRRNAGAPLSALWDTAVGRALAWRAAAVLAAGAALLGLRSGPGRARRLGAALVGVSAAAAMAVHVAAGHAAGGAGSRWTQVVGQWAHFLAAGVWVGGLVALLLGLRGAPSEAKAVAVRRFSTAAAVALLLVVATGVIRSLDQVPTRRDLTGSGYGRAVLVKVALVGAMAVLGGWNRRRSVPRAASTLRGLRRRSVGEIALGAAALATASVLATVSPPPGQAAEQAGLVAEGADYARSVRATVTAQTRAAGPNRFVVRLVAVEDDRPVRADRVTVRFEPLDDPGVAPSTLALAPEPEAGSYAGSGSNLSFGGRWGLAVLVERDDGSVTVPVELLVPDPPQFVSVERVPGRPVRYLVEVAPGLYVRIHTEPGNVHAAFFDDFGTDRPVDAVVITTTTAGRTRQHVTRSLAPGRFVAELRPDARPTDIAVVARAPDGTRLRAAVTLD